MPRAAMVIKAPREAIRLREKDKGKKRQPYTDEAVYLLHSPPSETSEHCAPPRPSAGFVDGVKVGQRCLLQRIQPLQLSNAGAKKYFQEKLAEYRQDLNDGARTDTEFQLRQEMAIKNLQGNNKSNKAAGAGDLAEDFRLPGYRMPSRVQMLTPAGCKFVRRCYCYRGGRIIVGDGRVSEKVLKMLPTHVSRELACFSLHIA